jgi:hypothetical protein
MSIYEERFTACVTRLLLVCQQPSAASAALSQVEDDAFFDPQLQFLVSGTRQAIAEHGNRTNTINLYPVLIRMAAEDGKVWTNTEAFDTWVNFWQKEHCQPWQDELQQAKECAVHINRHKTRVEIAVNAEQAAVVAKDPTASDEEALYACSEVSKAAESAAPHEPELLNDIIEEVRDGDPAVALRTGYGFWDDSAAGIWQGITILSGQPGAGKTALALQLVIGCLTTNENVKAVWGLGEMTKRDILHRAASCFSVTQGQYPIDLRDIRSNTKDGQAAIENLGASIGDRLAIVGDISIPNLCNSLVKYDASILVVDYMQLVPHGNEENRTAGLDGIAGELVRLCTMRGTHVIAISSLPKGSNSDSNIGSLARGSGMIDYAANSFYLGTFDDSVDKTQPYDIKWLCKKQRQGHLVDIQSNFDGDKQYFARYGVEVQEPDQDLAKAWGG